jgi:hypothetical protein
VRDRINISAAETPDGVFDEKKKKLFFWKTHFFFLQNNQLCGKRCNFIFLQFSLLKNNNSHFSFVVVLLSQFQFQNENKEMERLKGEERVFQPIGSSFSTSTILRYKSF